MLCERCKIREANIQYTEVMNGIRTEHHFCAQCARELDFGPYSAIFDNDFPLGKLLSGLLGINEDEQEDKSSKVICPACKTSYEEFVKDSCFGCPDCYGVFDLLISDNIRQLQGSDTHTGKHPRYHMEPTKTAKVLHAVMDATDTADTADTTDAGAESESLEEQIQIIKAKLQEALDREEYELAASCRDKIRTLKAEGHGGE